MYLQKQTFNMSFKIQYLRIILCVILVEIIFSALKQNIFPKICAIGHPNKPVLQIITVFDIWMLYIKDSSGFVELS